LIQRTRQPLRSATRALRAAKRARPTARFVLTHTHARTHASSPSLTHALAAPAVGLQILSLGNLCCNCANKAGIESVCMIRSWTERWNTSDCTRFSSPSPCCCAPAPPGLAGAVLCWFASHSRAAACNRNEIVCRNCERRGRSDEANEELVNEALAKSELKATLGLEVLGAGGRASEKETKHARVQRGAAGSSGTHVQASHSTNRPYRTGDAARVT
jgi:hypothetical protein